MKIKNTLLFLFTTLITGAAFANPPVEEGKAIFQARCAACHNVNKTLTGPALAGVDERRSLDWIINFVHSSQKVIKSGDPVAVDLFKKFNNIPMPDHTDLTKDNIKSVVEYIKSEAVATGPATAPFAKPAKFQTPYTPIALNNYMFWGSYLFVVLLLILGLLMAVKVKTAEARIRSTKM